MRASMTIACAALTAGLAAPAPAQDPDYARSIAATCTTCHGIEGRSAGGVPPSLAGQDKDHLLRQLLDFKSGRRTATIMQQHAKGYTDEQLELIAGYFAGTKASPGAAVPAARGGGY